MKNFFILSLVLINVLEIKSLQSRFSRSCSTFKKSEQLREILSHRKKFEYTKHVSSKEKKPKEKFNYFGCTPFYTIVILPNILVLCLKPIIEESLETFSYLLIFNSGEEYIGFYRINELIAKVESSMAKSIFKKHLKSESFDEKNIIFLPQVKYKKKLLTVKPQHYSHNDLIDLVNYVEKKILCLPTLADFQNKFFKNELSSAAVIYNNLYNLESPKIIFDDVKMQEQFVQSQCDECNKTVEDKSNLPYPEDIIYHIDKIRNKELRLKMASEKADDGICVIL